MRTIVAGNWKMHKDREGAASLIEEVKRNPIPAGVEVIVAPPFPFLAQAVERTVGTGIVVAAQNCHQQHQGAFTGEVSAAMLKSIGVRACIVGHSERRQYYNETDTVLAQKIAALLEHDITPIYCCGELKEERESGRHFEVVSRQLDTALSGLGNERLCRIVIAYEPVWAIGTGLTATAAQAQEMHAHIRTLMAAYGTGVAQVVPILYGGSCKPENAAELFANPDVNGGLIGGAALEAASFGELVRIAGTAHHAG